MNYEQKYKEALERARGIHTFSSDIAEIKRMEEIFPELKESGDERVRKEMTSKEISLDEIALKTFDLLISNSLVRRGDVCPQCGCCYLINGMKCLNCNYDGEEKNNDERTATLEDKADICHNG